MSAATHAYVTTNRLAGPTGSDVQRIMASIRARLIARYQLHSVPGRPEELTENRGTYVDAPEGKTVSIGYGCKTIRIRKHNGRRWVDTLDIPVRDGWYAEVYAYLDPFFGFVSPAILA